jgi:hypothetical protein
MTSEKALAARTRHELAQIAKHNKVEGWHDMKKADLIDALKNRRLVKVPEKPAMTERIKALKAQESQSNHAPLRRTQTPNSPTNDQQSRKAAGHHPVRLEANARPGQGEFLHATPQGPYWIYASWLLTPAILERAEASLGANWHQAAPVLRVYDVLCDEDTSPTKRCMVRIPIQAAVEYWHVPIADPARTYELQLGYETPKGQYFMLARSAPVKLPLPGTPQARKYEEQRQDGMFAASVAESVQRFPIRGSSAYRYCEDVSLEVRAELLIVGKVTPQAHLTCQEEKVSVQKNGTFEIRLPLEEGRQVIPLEAISPDGCESRTVVLAIERNTKTLAPQALNDWDD